MHACIYSTSTLSTHIPPFMYMDTSVHLFVHISAYHMVADAKDSHFTCRVESALFVDEHLLPEPGGNLFMAWRDPCKGPVDD